MSNIDEKIEAILRDHAKSILNDIELDFLDCVGCCESPIEKIMLARLATLRIGYGHPHPTHNTLWPHGIDSGPNGGLSVAGFELAVLPQEKLGNYRVDFLLVLGIPNPKSGGVLTRKYIVECDGHDFHEKTKQQASRDKARDRYLQSLGYPVFRYTGSEIFANEPSLLMDLIKTMWLNIEDILRS